MAVTITRSMPSTAAATIDLFSQPQTIAAAKAEFETHTAGGFTSPIPPEAVPVIPDLT